MSNKNNPAGEHKEMPLRRRSIRLTTGQEATIKNLKSVSEGETRKYRRVNNMEEEGSIEGKDVKQRKMSRGKENERERRERSANVLPSLLAKENRRAISLCANVCVRARATHRYTPAPANN